MEVRAFPSMAARPRTWDAHWSEANLNIHINDHFVGMSVLDVMRWDLTLRN